MSLDRPCKKETKIVKKSAIVTLTLSLVLIMSGCSTESNTEETSIQNKWNVFAEKISDVCSNLTSTLTIECDASDLTPEQIQDCYCSQGAVE